MFREAALRARGRSEGELLLLQPPRAWMFTLVTLLVVALVGFALFQGQFARSQNVAGLLVPSKGLIKIYADGLLTVVEVLREEGDVVAEGAPLIRLARHQTDGSGDDVNATKLSLLQQRKVLAEEKLHAAERSFQAKMLQLNRRRKGAQQQSIELARQSQQQALVAESASRQFAKLEELATRQLISDAEVEQSRRSWLSSEVGLHSSRRLLAQMQAEIQTLHAQQKTLKAEFALDRLGMEDALLSLETQRIGISEQLETAVVAPAGAIVQGIHVAPGQLTMPRRPLATLFPAGATLEAELYVPGSVVGVVRVGQRIQLSYDAFPFDKYGSYGATVSHVSYVILRGDELETPLALSQPVYRVTAVLDSAVLENLPEAFELKPGMTFSTSIMAERRRLIDWLLGPLKRVAGRYWDAAPAEARSVN